MVCDRHAFYREWLRDQLEEEIDLEIVAEVEEADGALEVVLQVNPDVVLVESETRTIPGVELGRVLRELLPELKVIVLAASEEEVGLARLIAMKEGGADALLLTDAQKGEIASAIRAVTKGRWVAARAVAEPLFEETLSMLVAERSRPIVCPNCGHEWTHQSPLSDRDRRVLKLVGKGYTNRAIANELGLSEGTIKNYVHKILNKLDLSSRLEAAVYAAKEGLI
jgi:DNA-binding NarL/FixJ family response regulator